MFTPCRGYTRYTCIIHNVPLDVNKWHALISSLIAVLDCCLTNIIFLTPAVLRTSIFQSEAIIPIVPGKESLYSLVLLTTVRISSGCHRRLNILVCKLISELNDFIRNLMLQGE